MRHEPENIVSIRNNTEVWQVFFDVGWDIYFDRLQGFDGGITMKFALNLEENYSRVRVLEVPITEEVIAEVSGLRQQGQQWFSRKFSLAEFPNFFL